MTDFAQQSWILDVLSGLSSICLVLMQMWVLPTRSVRRFLSVGILLAAMTVLMRPTLGLIPDTLPIQFLRTLFGVVLTFFLWPYSQWTVKHATRLIMCALLVVHMLVFELAYIAISGLWYGGACPFASKYCSSYRVMHFAADQHAHSATVCAPVGNGADFTHAIRIHRFSHVRICVAMLVGYVDAISGQ